MAISEFLLLRTRKGVAHIGDELSEEDKNQFIDRGFLIEVCTDANLKDSLYLSGYTAIVFSAKNRKRTLEIANYLEKYAKDILDHDCRIIIRPPPQSRSIIINAINNLKLPTAGLYPEEEIQLETWRPKKGQSFPLPPHIHIVDVATTWRDIANIIAMNPASYPPDKNLKINSPNHLTLSEEILLRRAFWDCSVVDLIPMLDGLSGISVYHAYAELAAGLKGAWAHQYFVKIGKREDILKEYQNYEKLVRPYIPFHLGPHLIHSRCCLGADTGIIVGDFVEESESLRDCANQGRAATAIASLFNKTLRGWYARAEENSQDSVAQLLTKHFPTALPERRKSAAKVLGSKRDLGELRKLFEMCSSTPVKVGLAHGDLHATNVLVRGTDAILIDFLKCNDDHPLVYDAACLEVGLLIEGFTDEQQQTIDWLQTILPLYDNVFLDKVPICHPKNNSFWFYECVRQIRLHARQMEHRKGQYAGALAVALLKKACKDIYFSPFKESRRTAAYILAEHVLITTFEPDNVNGCP